MKLIQAWGQRVGRHGQSEATKNASSVEKRRKHNKNMPEARQDTAGVWARVSENMKKAMIARGSEMAAKA